MYTMSRQLTLLILGGELMNVIEVIDNAEAIDAEVINTVDLGGQINDHRREAQQSTFTWKIQKI